MIEGVTLGERYQVFGRIGGSALVVRYDGVDTLLARPVDIVTLTEQAAKEPDILDQFVALGRAAATRSHPHIVDVYDLGTFEGRPFIVTEHLTGESLRSIIDEEAPFHPDDAVALIQQLAQPADNEATSAAGGGAVSVDTVVVDAAGIAKHSDLLTFGERYAAAQDEWAGRTRPAMAPAGPVPAIAAIAYELLTGRAPSAGMLSARPSSVNAAVTSDIDRIVLRALDPRLRDFPSATAFASALTAAARRAREIRESVRETTAATPRPRQAAPPRLAVVAETKTLTAAHQPVPPSEPAHSPALLVGEANERVDRTAPRGLRWTWVAIAVLAVLVLVLGVERMRDTDTPVTTGETPTQQSADNDVPVQVQKPTDDSVAGVPAISGMTRDAAAAELAKDGLVLQEESSVYSETVAAGLVVEQNPPAGDTIPDNRTVYVKLSRGPAVIDVASLDLTGKDVAVAKQALTTKGLSVQTREEGSTSVPVGKVVSVEPDGTVAPNSVVTLVVSVGDKVQIPRDIFSTPLQDAEAKLTAAGIEVAGTIAVGPAAIQGRLDTTQYQIASGDVIGVQNQQGDAAFGAWIPRGSAVTLVYFNASG